MNLSPPRGAAAFQAYYHSLFKEETDALLSGLTRKIPPVVWLSTSHISEVKTLWAAAAISWQPLSWFPQTVRWPAHVPFPSPLPGIEEKWGYLLSMSSVAVVKALRLKSTDTVLDACAAPGGKSLLIAAQLTAASQLTANDMSPVRFNRLRSTLFDYGFRTVSLTNKPAERLYLYYHNVFDKILLDAPCSSEQHVISDSKHLAKWKYQRIEALVHRQQGLLTTLAKCLKPGGLLVYSTCAITPEENEGVISHFLTNHPDWQLLPALPSSISHDRGLTLWSSPSMSNHVVRFYPHRHNQSPAFIAVLQKP